MLRAVMDLNVRTPTGTFVGFEDLDGDLPTAGESILLVEEETELSVIGTVESLDFDAEIVNVHVDWGQLGPFPELGMITPLD